MIFNVLLSCRKDKEAPWHKEFKKNQKRMLIHLHVLHPALRQCLSICKDHLNTTTMANCDGFGGDAIDLDSFCGNLISECEKSEEHLLNTWFPKITAVFTDKKIHIKHKGERLSRFYRCASSLVSIQVCMNCITFSKIVSANLLKLWLCKGVEITEFNS